MNTDLLLVIGIVLAAFSIPAVLSAYANRHQSRFAVFMVFIAGGLVALALVNSPSGYTLGEVPEAFVRVIGRLLN